MCPPLDALWTWTRSRGGVTHPHRGDESTSAARINRGRRVPHVARDVVERPTRLASDCDQRSLPGADPLTEPQWSEGEHRQGPAVGKSHRRRPVPVVPEEQPPSCFVVQARRSLGPASVAYGGGNHAPSQPPALGTLRAASQQAKEPMVRKLRIARPSRWGSVAEAADGRAPWPSGSRHVTAFPSPE
jgi:hypothetical protein